IPIISQCPVTESFPADASAIRPAAAGVGIGIGVGVGVGVGVSVTRRSSPSDRRVGIFNGTRFAMLPTVLLPSSPYAAASGSSPMRTLSMTMTMTRLKGVTRAYEWEQ